MRNRALRWGALLLVLCFSVNIALAIITNVPTNITSADDVALRKFQGIEMVSPLASMAFDAIVTSLSTCVPI